MEAINPSDWKNGSVQAKYPKVEITKLPKYLGLALQVIPTGEYPLTTIYKGVDRQLALIDLSPRTINVLLKAGAELKYYTGPSQEYIICSVDDYIESMEVNKDGHSDFVDSVHNLSTEVSDRTI